MEWIALKSGWLYEKRSGVFPLAGKRWEPRWVVIYGEPMPALGVYEQRSDAQPPYAPLRHLDLLPDTQVRGAEDRKGPASSLLAWLKKGSVGGGGGVAKGMAAADLNSETASINSSFADLSLQLQGASTGKDAVFWISRSNGVKLCFAAKNRRERDEWIGALKGVLLAAEAESKVSGVDAEVGSPLTPALSPVAPQNDCESISFGGVVILGGRAVAKIKSGAISHNPLDQSPSGSASADSIVGIMASSQEILALDTKEELDDLNVKYQQAVLDHQRSDNLKDIQRLELAISRLVGRFHDLMGDRMKKAIDEYHNHREVITTLVEDGALKINLIANYGEADEEVIDAANAWMRQEMNAARWIGAKRKIPFLQPLMTVCEYKGFRAFAILTLPIGDASSVQGEDTLVMDVANGVWGEEGIVNHMRATAMAMNLSPSIPFRAADGRMLQLSLPPTVEVHQVTEAASQQPIPRRKAGKTVKTPPGLYLLNVHDTIPFCGQNYFRPEFIEAYPVPVAHGDMLPESKLALMQNLKEQCLATALNQLESLSVLPLDSEEWRCFLHGTGINMSLLGALAKEARLPHIKDSLIVEMIARSSKAILRGRLRNAILHFREVQASRVEEELSAIVLESVNSLLSMEESFVADLRAVMADRFNYILESDTMRHLSRNMLLTAIIHHCCLCFKESVFARNGRVLAEDFEGFSMRITDGGNGPIKSSIRPTPHPNFKASKEGMLVEFGCNLLPAGKALWSMPGKRAIISKQALSMADIHMEERQWDDAMKMVELATGLCPKQHPQQILIALKMVKIRTLGPVNLAWRAPVLGEKPSAAVTREELAMEEMRKSKINLLHRVDRHFGGNHPLAITVRLEIASLMEGVRIGREEALGLRLEALSMAYKILGRRHDFSRKMLIDLADAQYAAAQYDEAISSYSEALKMVTKEANLQYGLAKCWQAKGDYENALEWAKECRQTMDAQSEAAAREGRSLCLPIYEQVLETIADLSQAIFTSEGEVSIISGSHASGASLHHSRRSSVASPQPHAALSKILAEDVLALPIVEHLKTAIECYGRLFDLKRQKSEIKTTAEGEELLRLARRIVVLCLRLASPIQRPVIKASIRKRLFQSPTTTMTISPLATHAAVEGDREAQVRELLVRMVSGPQSPQEMTERILLKVQSSDTLPEAERDLSLLLDLIELTSA